jgi:hypothetical protein
MSSPMIIMMMTMIAVSAIISQSEERLEEVSHLLLVTLAGEPVEQRLRPTGRPPWPKRLLVPDAVGFRSEGAAERCLVLP